MPPAARSESIPDWAALLEDAGPCPLMGTILRMVESQEQVATNRIVSSLEHQRELEQMLEEVKPGVETKPELHYLLSTPFRYPPLKHGSRFGTRSESSLFYGSHTPTTVLAETAYYRFHFWLGMEQPPSESLTTQHTLFGARFATRNGVRLHKQPMSEHEGLLRHPASYAATQALGVTMRECGVEAFEYVSARDRAQGINIALFTASVLTGTRPVCERPWLCETGADEVSFLGMETREVHKFPLSDFLFEGRFPMPA